LEEIGVANIAKPSTKTSNAVVASALKRGREFIRSISQKIKTIDSEVHDGVVGAESSASSTTAARALAHFMIYRGATAFFYEFVEPLWTKQVVRAYRLVTFGSTYMRSADIQMARAHLHDGDMVVGRCEAAATTNAIEWLGSRWTHVGLYIGNGLVVEALDSSGVVVTSLALFMRRYTRVAVYRVDQSWNVEAGVRYALAQVGKPYNFAFLFSEKKFYCSQLVWHSLIEGGVRFAPPKLNRMGYPVVNPDQLIYDNREHLQVVWSAGHEIFRNQAEAIIGVSRMTAQLVISIISQQGAPAPGRAELLPSEIIVNDETESKQEIKIAS
jgi:hypothetical protein